MGGGRRENKCHVTMSLVINGNLDRGTKMKLRMGGGRRENKCHVTMSLVINGNLDRGTKMKLNLKFRG